MFDLPTLAEHLAEVLDVGPGTRVFEVDCGNGEFLYPFHQNGYVVGGIDGDADLIAEASAAMPDGSFHVAPASALDPAVPWHVVVWRHSDAPKDASAGALAKTDHLRGVLSRMFAKATHAIALLDVPDTERQWMLRALAEIGATAIQFEDASAKPPSYTAHSPGPGAFHLFARV